MEQGAHADPNQPEPGIRAGLRRGWTTGSCATAAAKSAYVALRTGMFPDPVSIVLPAGGVAAFALAEQGGDAQSRWAGVVKDAGDDPDVTHGALIRASVRLLPAGSGIRFRAGEGVGTITRPGLALPPGEPAINPVPRRMIEAALTEAAGGVRPDVEVTVSVPGGERLAERTLNARLGIVGGLSILGTTGIVVPFSCAAWIDTIRRGIDVARALGLSHVAGSTGNASEQAIQRLHGLPDPALIEMGDFAGGMLKYLRDHPVPRVSIAGGVAKLSKLAEGRLDLHSKRGRPDLQALAACARACGASEAQGLEIASANTVAEAFDLAQAAGLKLGDAVAARAWDVAADVLAGTGTELELVLFDREGGIRGRTPFLSVDGPHSRNRLR